MPKTRNKYPYNVSAAITTQLRKLLNEEIDDTHRSLSEIIREALEEYFDVFPEEDIPVPITLLVTSQERLRLSELGYVPCKEQP